MKKPFTTPGPWTVGKTAKDSNGVIRNRIHPEDDSDNTVCVVSGLVGSKPGPVSNANAKLIAAAPSMLDALEEITKAHLLGMGKSAIQLRIELCLDAIKKAKGE